LRIKCRPASWEFDSLSEYCTRYRSRRYFPKSLDHRGRGNDVVKVLILSIKSATAILTSVLVAFEDVMPGKFNFFFRKTIKDQQDNPGHANLE
jgi:hypothetical protein